LLTSKENINYYRSRFIIFLLGLAILIFSESLLGYVNQASSKNIILIFTPLIVFMFIYIFFQKKLKIN